MTDIHTVPIHHVDLDAESWVPPETVDHWVALGWVEGPLERLQAPVTSRPTRTPCAPRPPRTSRRSTTSSPLHASPATPNASRSSCPTRPRRMLPSSSRPHPIAASRTSGRGEPAPFGGHQPHTP
jgi:hypothetical protein